MVSSCIINWFILFFNPKPSTRKQDNNQHLQSHTNDDIIPLNIIIGSGSNVDDFKNSRKKTYLKKISQKNSSSKTTMPTYFMNYIDFMKIFEPILFKETFKHLG